MDKTNSKNQLIFFYGITFIISWAAWLVMSRVYDGENLSAIVYVFSTLGGLGPLLALATLSKFTGGEISLKQILSQIRFRDWKNIWIGAAIFAIPLITLLGNFANHVFGSQDHLQIIQTGPDELGLLVLPVMLIQFAAGLVTSPLFEEPGWRGFALPRLQGRFGRTLGSLSVGLLWWLWHQPMNITFGLEPTIIGALAMIIFSFTIDSLYNLTGGNLLAAMLAHQSYSTTITFLYDADLNWFTFGLNAALLLLIRAIEYSKKETPAAESDLGQQGKSTAQHAALADEGRGLFKEIEE